MTPELALSLAGALATALVRASLEGAVLAVVVWAVLRLRPAWPASVRCALWWLVCARFLVSLAWPAPVLLPIVPAGWVPQAWYTHVDAGKHTTERAPGPRAAGPMTPDHQPAALSGSDGPVQSARGTALPLRATAVAAMAHWWPLPVAALWFAGVGASLWRLATLLRRERRVLAHAVPATAFAQRHVDELAGCLGLVPAPCVLVSADVASPCVIAGRRPRIVMPRALDEPTAHTNALRLAVCHELVHLKRHDLAWALVPALAERLLFFHPAARLSAREYALAREAACDAAVLDVLRAPADDYARVLLAFAIPRRRATLGMSGASRSPAMLKRRLVMLDDTVHRTSRKPSPWAVSLLAALALAPLQVGATRSVDGAVSPADAAAVQATPQAPPAPAAPEAPTARPAAAARASAVTQPPPPPPPAPPRPPAPPPPPPDATDVRDAFDRVADAWVLLKGDSSEGIQSGSRGDRSRASSYRRGSEPLFWFRRGSEEFVIRDRATLEAIEALFKPQRELGQRMGALGSRQGELGAEQGKLGAQQGEMGAKQAAIAAQQVAMTAKEMRTAEREAQESALRSERQQLEQQMRALGDRQRELGRKQEALGELQRELGRQQDALGKQMRELTVRVATELKSLVDQSIGNGGAERVK